MTAAARNRANAQHSTGPKTPEGKAASSQNARKHGLSGRLTLRDQAEKERFRRRIDEIAAFYNLANPLAAAAIEALVTAEFRRAQAFEAEQNVLAQLKLKVLESLEDGAPIPDKDELDGLARMLDVESTRLLIQLNRHYSAADRSWHRHYKTLKELQAAEQPAGAQNTDFEAIKAVMQGYAEFLQNEATLGPPPVHHHPEDRAA